MSTGRKTARTASGRGPAATELLFGGAGTDSPIADLGLAVLRVVAGLALAFLHGLGKMPPSERFMGRVTEMGLPAPEMFAWLAALAELGGGFCWRWGCLPGPPRS